MSNETSQNGTTANVTTTETPPPPIANGSSNGATAHVEAPVVTAPPQGASAEPAADATAEASASAPASKKDKKRDRKKERESKNAVSSDAAAKVFPTTVTTETANPEVAPAATTAAAEPEPAKLDAETPVTPDPQPVSVPPAPKQPAPEATTAGAPPVTTQEGGLRLRMKVWTDPETLKRYLVATAFMRDMVNGQPVSDVMRAYAMSEEDTRVITLRVVEWNTLPFYYFQEDGPAPRASRRPVDRIG